MGPEMAAPYVNLVKLCVGADSVEDLARWQAARIAEDPETQPRHITRMWPKRAEEILAGGSLYWVIRGAILARQRILAFDPIEGADGIRRCAIRLDPPIIRTVAATRRPFQGWRYLSPADAPRDLPQARKGETVLPPGLAEALAEFGLR